MKTNSISIPNVIASKSLDQIVFSKSEKSFVNVFSHTVRSHKIFSVSENK